MKVQDSALIRRNISAHDRIATRYEEEHVEIYNPHEQMRLLNALRAALSLLPHDRARTDALDFGCGAGNLTRHLMSLGCDVVAADVSPAFLELVRARFENSLQLRTFTLNGQNLSGLPTASFDFVGAYSVLHHVPDYLAAVGEMARVVKSNGVVFLDHELNESYWQQSAAYAEFRRLVRPERSWRRFLVPYNYYFKLRTMMNPRFRDEGDIHVFPDDHIEWGSIEQVLAEHGCRVVHSQDYLLCARHYPQDVYDTYAPRCTDMRLLVAQKAA